MFVHLHVHTEYSLLDGAARIKSAVKTAKEMGMPALAVTDHGSMFGVVDFYKACMKEEIKPILGCEVYVAPRTMADRTPRVDDNLYHLVLLAENDEGYRNLLKLVSMAYTEGFYYKPRVDKAALAAHSKGLIALSGCIAGEVASHYLAGEPEKARKAAMDYRDIFGADNFYLELQDHGFAEQRTANRELLGLHSGTGIPLVVTNDVHYVRREHAEMQDVLLCIQTGKTVDAPSRMKFQSQELYLKSEEEMNLLFGELREAMDNTLRIAERCKVNLSFGTLHLPVYNVPDGYTVDTYLEELCLEGIKWRYGEMTEPVRQRLDFELKVIRQMGYSAYFLIVWDFIHFARESKIPVGPGRGSAAGSLVAYVLGITNLDPLRYHLLFERFLNPERVSMPDIDIDFCFERRAEVISYVARKYGADRVAQIATFGTMAARAAIRDVGRALSMPYGDVDRVAKLVPMELHITLEKALNDSSDLKELYDYNPQVKKLIDMAILLEGMPRHASTHAAGVVITREPLTYYLPLYKATDGPLTTQFAKDQVEELGLLKMDLLGLRTLTVIADALKMIESNRGESLDIETIPLDDPASYGLLSRGDGIGVFQLESSGMRAILKELRPEVFEDIVALVALYRPGPLGSGMVDDFIKNKHGLKKVTYLHPKLEPILKDTYGVILYQEQVMRIASDLAGFTLGEADLLRRAMGKKKPEIIAGLRTQFVEGAVKNNVDAEIAGQIFDLMEYFAGYGFNKCLTGDTRVALKDGQIVTIKQIYENNLFMETFSINDDLKIVPSKIIGACENGVKKVFKLKTRTGREIKATDNHPFLTFAGWKQLYELGVGERVAIPRKLPLNNKMSMPKHQLALLAYVISEGNTCHPYTFYYYTNSQEELDDYLYYLNQFEGATGTVKQRNGKLEVHAVNKNKGSKERNEAKEFIENIGLKWKNAGEKALPDIIFQLTDECLSFLLGRLWVGDGCIDHLNKIIYYATSSPVLATQIQHLLLRLGIQASLYDKTIKYRDGIKKVFTVSISGYAELQLFVDLIGDHLVGARSRDLDKLINIHPYLCKRIPLTFARGSRDLIPYEVFMTVREEIAKNSGRMSLKQIASKIGISERNLWRVNTKSKKGYRRETIQAISDYIKSPVLDRIAYSDVLWDEIVSIEPDGEEMTYDLTIEGTHNFIANDIIVHNSHSAAYALVSYQTAYLKANYPVEYMAALLTSVRDNTDKVAAYIEESRRMGIEVLPPDVNESRESFTVIGDKIRFGLAAIKNVGLAAVEAIIQTRENDGPFQSFPDFCSRLDTRVVNRRVMENLIKGGAFDSLGYRRAQLMASVDAGVNLAQQTQKEKANGQLSLLDFWGEEAKQTLSLSIPDLDEYPRGELLTLEKEALGLYITGHPLAEYRRSLAEQASITVAEIRELEEETNVVVGGMFTSIKRITTRKGDPMAFATLEDLTGALEVVFFPRVYEQHKKILATDTALLVKGKANISGEEPKILADEISPLARKIDGELYLKLDGASKDLLAKIKILLKSYPGPSPVYIYYHQEKKLSKTSRDHWVDLSSPVLGELKRLLGTGNVKVKET